MSFWLRGNVAYGHGVHEFGVSICRKTRKGLYCTLKACQNQALVVSRVLFTVPDMRSGVRSQPIREAVECSAILL